MMVLGKEHIALIKNYLTSELRLENQDFIDEMTDHYACALEEKLSTGKAWQEAIKEIDASLGGQSALKEMEKEYKKQQYSSSTRKHRSLLKSYFISFPKNVFVLFLWLMLYMIYTHDVSSIVKWSRIIFFANCIIGLSGFLISVSHIFYLKMKINKHYFLIRHASLFVINIGNISMIIRYLPDSHLAMAGSIYNSLVIIASIVCLQIIYETYPKLKTKTIA